MDCRASRAAEISADAVESAESDEFAADVFAAVSAAGASFEELPHPVRAVKVKQAAKINEVSFFFFILFPPCFKK